MSELLPCPFCGGPASFYENQVDFVTKWSVYCHVCDASMDACEDDKADAANIWNTRAAPPMPGWLPPNAIAALFAPIESHAALNLEGALTDIKRFKEAGRPTDDVCIRTIERVIKQLIEAEAALTAPASPEAREDKA